MSKETTSNKTKKRVASFFGRIVVYILVLVLIAGIPFAYKFGHSVFYASSVDSPPGRNIQVNVAEGMSFDKLADTLYEIQARFFDIRMHTGEYTFNTSQTSREILEMIDEGVLEKNINDNKS